VGEDTNAKSVVDWSDSGTGDSAKTRESASATLLDARGLYLIRN